MIIFGVIQLGLISLRFPPTDLFSWRKFLFKRYLSLLCIMSQNGQTRHHTPPVAITSA